MNQRTPLPFVERNPLTYKKHQHEVFWQITIPLAMGVILVVAVAVLTVTATTAGQKSQLADIALINLMIPAMIFGVIQLAFLGLSLYGIIKLIMVLPFAFRRIQDFFSLAGFRINQVTDAMIEPFIRAKGFTASTRALGRSVTRKRS